MNTDTKVITDLEEMLAESIPCAGIAWEVCQRECGREAELQWTNPHGCTVSKSKVEPFKCADCWMVFYQNAANLLARKGSLQCMHCQRTFRSVLAFTDFRPF